MTDTAKPFEVRYTLTVDRPELRGPSYSPIAAGTKVQFVDCFATQGAAVRRFEAMLRGEWDYPSEYVSSVDVVARPRRLPPNTTWMRPRTVRRWVKRDRQESARQRARAMLQVASARKGHYLAFYELWYCERLAATLASQDSSAQEAA